MLAVVGGLGAAIVFATVTLCNSPSSRMIGPNQLLAWVMLIGLIITGPLALAQGVPAGLDSAAAWWMAVAGIGNVVGLLLAYSALRVGQVGLVAPIVSTQGAIAALIAIVAGESLGAATAALLGVVTIGVTMAAIAPADPTAEGARQTGAAALLAIGAAVAIGWSLYAIGRVSVSLPVVWALLPSRVIGAAFVTLPIALGAGLRMTRSALPLVLVSGAFEVLGFALFAFGSRHGIAISAVLSSQFAAIAGIAAYILFRERLSSLQLAGVIVVVVGVGALSAVQAS